MSIAAAPATELARALVSSLSLVVDFDLREGEDARVLKPSSTCVLFELFHLQPASKALAPETRVETDVQ